MVLEGECFEDINDTQAAEDRLKGAITYVNDMNTFYYVLSMVQLGFLLIVVSKGLYNLWDKQ